MAFRGNEPCPQCRVRMLGTWVKADGWDGKERFEPDEHDCKPVKPSLAIATGEEAPGPVPPPAPGSVHVLPVTTRHTLPVERVLDGAKGCHSVVVLGFTPEGLLYVATSYSHVGDVLLLMERAKQSIISTTHGGIK